LLRLIVSVAAVSNDAAENHAVNHVSEVEEQQQEREVEGEESCEIRSVQEERLISLVDDADMVDDADAGCNSDLAVVLSDATENHENAPTLEADVPSNNEPAADGSESKEDECLISWEDDDNRGSDLAAVNSAIESHVESRESTAEDVASDNNPTQGLLIDADADAVASDDHDNVRADNVTDEM